MRLRLAAEIEKDTPDTEVILCVHHVSLSYRLLQYINSAVFSFREKITSIRQALTLLWRNENKILAAPHALL